MLVYNLVNSDTFFLFPVYTEVDPLTTVRSLSPADTWHSAFGRKYKIQLFMRSRLASWDYVTKQLAQHEHRLRNHKYKDTYEAKFLRLQMTEGMPEDVVLELPQEYNDDPYTQCCVYIAPYNKKGTRSAQRNFRKENFKSEEIEMEEAKQLWEKEYKWFEENPDSCIHDFT